MNYKIVALLLVHVCASQAFDYHAWMSENCAKEVSQGENPEKIERSQELNHIYSSSGYVVEEMENCIKISDFNTKRKCRALLYQELEVFKKMYDPENPLEVQKGLCVLNAMRSERAKLLDSLGKKSS